MASATSVLDGLHEKYLDFLDGQGSLVTTQDGQGQLVHQGSRCFSHTSGSVITRGKDGLERQGRCRLPALRASRAAWRVGARRERCQFI